MISFVLKSFPTAFLSQTLTLTCPPPRLSPAPVCGYFSVSLPAKVLNEPLMNHSLLLRVTPCPLFASLFALSSSLTSSPLQHFYLLQSSGVEAFGTWL